jgi:hypothetical protein
MGDVNSCVERVLLEGDLINNLVRLDQEIAHNNDYYVEDYVYITHLEKIHMSPDS